MTTVRRTSKIVAVLAILAVPLVILYYFARSAESEREAPVRFELQLGAARWSESLKHPPPVVPGPIDPHPSAPASAPAPREGDDPLDRMEWLKSDTLFPKSSAPGWVRSGTGSRISKSRSAVLGRPTVKPGKTNEIAGYSGLEATFDEAIRSARLSLQRQLEDIVLYELIEDGDRHGARSPEGGALLRQAAASLVEAGPAGREEFHESAVLPASGQTIHRAAILLRIPDGWDDKQERAIGRRLDAVREESEESRRTQIGTAGSILLLAFVVFLLYLFVNAGTKGYFAWPLRIFAVALYACVCLGLLYGRGHFQ